MPLESGATFPDHTLPDPEGVLHPLAGVWTEGAALILFGHRNCKTTRETLPYVDRIHRGRARGTSTLAILQDDADTAREIAAELNLTLPIRLEAHPYPLADALKLVTVPTLFLVETGGRIAAVSEAFRRTALEDFAQRLGVAPLFGPEDRAPALKPG